MGPSHWVQTSHYYWTGPRGCAVPASPFSSGLQSSPRGVGWYPGTGWFSQDPERVCAPGTQGNCPRLSGVKGFQYCNWSIPTWPMRIWRIRWSKLPKTTHAVSGSPRMSVPSTHSHTHRSALPGLTCGDGGKGVCYSVGRSVRWHSGNLDLLCPCPHSTPACFSTKFNAVVFLGTRVEWLKPKPLTSSLPSRACLLPWLTVSSSPGCTSVHGGFLATGWWSLPRQDVYLP